ncbi:hypothetical protein Ancab_030323 [Ancistrocladus abbreviatus]
MVAASPVVASHKTLIDLLSKYPNQIPLEGRLISEGGREMVCLCCPCCLCAVLVVFVLDLASEIYSSLFLCSVQFVGFFFYDLSYAYVCMYSLDGRPAISFP